MEENFLSLYDFLKKAAGSSLGKEVQKVATLNNVPIQIKEVQTKTYEGKINMYPKWFLEQYFGRTSAAESSTQVLYNEPDNL